MYELRPYFLENPLWYSFDEIEWMYKLTTLGQSIPKVKKSYDDFYKEVDGDA